MGAKLGGVCCGSVDRQCDFVAQYEGELNFQNGVSVTNRNLNLPSPDEGVGISSVAVCAEAETGPAGAARRRENLRSALITDSDRKALQASGTNRALTKDQKSKKVRISTAPDESSKASAGQSKKPKRLSFDMEQDCNSPQGRSPNGKRLSLEMASPAVVAKAGEDEWAKGEREAMEARALIFSSLKRSPVLSQFPHSKLLDIVKAMRIERFDAEAQIEDARFMLVLEGQLRGVFMGEARLMEPMSVVEDGLPLLDEDSDDSDDKSNASSRCPSMGPTLTVNLSIALNRVPSMSLGSFRAALESKVSGLSAGSGGCRLAFLSEAGLARALKEDSIEKALEITRKMLLVKKVHIFRHMSESQMDRVVRSFTPLSFDHEEFVFHQGDTGTSFYVIAYGEVQVLMEGKSVHTMGKNSYFGERALLYNEPRKETVQVTSSTAELWSIEKSVFLELVSGMMLEQVMSRIKLYDLRQSGMQLTDLKHLKAIGSGATAVVRLVEHTETKTRYALKQIRKHRGKAPPGVEREVNILKENDHPFIMYVVKTFETEKSIFLLTELISGGELHEAIRVLPNVLSRVEAQFYTGSIVLALEQLYDRFIVYRDLKPENLMLDQQGYMKLIDFGISKKLSESSQCTFSLVGTPHYMAPEVIAGIGHSMAADLWSLGVIHYEFVCGFLPFGDELAEPADVCRAVLEQELVFPDEYRDSLGQDLVQQLCERDPYLRMGAGSDGYEEVKRASFFMAGHQDASQTLFEKLMARELKAPWIPDGDSLGYSTERDVDMSGYEPLCADGI